MTEFLTTEEVAAIARTSPSTVRYWHARGTGPRSAKIGRRRLYPRDELETWLTAAKAAG